MTTSILLVDDHPVFLKGLRSLLDDEADMNVIGMAGDGRQAFEIIRDLRPEVVVMDISMPGINGIEATKQIVSQFPETRVIALSIHSEKEFVENMLKAGAIGYIVKESVPEELVKGIRCVMEGKSYLSPAITGLILSRFRNSLFEEAAACPADFEIIESKLKPEKITEYYICRQRLLNILNDKRHLPLFTITAPAGYGKTTLAASWIADIDWPCVWLSLDKSDNDLHRFLGYLVHSIRAIFPDALERFSIAVASNPLPPIQPIAAKLLNDINQLNTNFLIVLDNFHHIRDKRINDFLNELFRYPPKSMHWLLVGRSDPFLSLSKFRAKGQLGEIRLNELRFTQAEASLFLTRLVNGPVDTEWVYQVTKRTEGWVTGLLLSALARGDGKNVRQVMSKMGPHREFVMDYLFHEVFDSRSDPMKQGLLIASVLNSFNRAVCEALFENFCGDDDQQPMSGKDFVERIRKENLFVVSQYKEGEWFRFHLEFQHFLQNQLRYEKGPEAIPKLHSLAFTWFRDSGHTDQAIFHAVAAGQISDAEDLIENNRWDVLDSDRRDQLRKWVELLPEGANNNRAGILLTKAWNLLMSLRITEILPTIRQVEALSNKIESQKYRISEILFFKGVVAYFKGDSDSSLKLFDKAKNQLPQKSPRILQSEIDFFKWAALHLKGNGRDAFNLIKERTQTIKEGSVLQLAKSSFAASYISMLDGQLISALKYSQPIADICVNNTIEYTGIWNDYIRGNIAFQKLDLETAHFCFSRVVTNRFLTHHRVGVDALAGLALTNQFMGNEKEADKALELAKAYAKWTKDFAIREIVGAASVRLALLRDDVNKVGSWPGVIYETSVGPGTMFFIEIPLVTECRFLIETHSREELNRAQEKLQSLYTQVATQNNTYHKFEILIIQAWVHHLKGNEDNAVQLMEHVIDLAVPQGWVRPFFELGKPMAELLGSLARKNISKKQVKKILKFFETNELPLTPQNNRDSGRNIQNSRTPQILVDPITNREMEILELLTQHLYNKEIAEKLFISPETVKSHLKRVYEKLMVSNRRQAVSKAYQLGILRRNSE